MARVSILKTNGSSASRSISVGTATAPVSNVESHEDCTADRSSISTGDEKKSRSHVKLTPTAT